ncbi:hypothetical protein GF322_03410 [Candidatus Dependentiae bacterium]|nr:hypothetical protein [Candidatus Dependentiae bacterium]
MFYKNIIKKIILFLNLLFFINTNFINANIFEEYKNKILNPETCKTILKINNQNYENTVDYTMNYFDKIVESYNIYYTYINLLKYIDELKASIELLKLSNPINLLIECDEKDCNLSRDHKNEYTRQILEDEILNYTQMFYKNKNQPIVITELGSGGLFQNLVIMTKILNSGYNNIKICLIDLSYETFYDVYQNEDNYTNLLQPKNLILYTHFYLTEQKFYQYFNFLKTNFPNANIEIKIFPDLNTYLLECNENAEFKTDIFLSIDTITPNSPDKIINDLICFHTSKALKIGGLIFHCFDAKNIESDEIDYNCYPKKNVISIMQKKYDLENINLPDFFNRLEILMHIPQKPVWLNNYQIIKNYVFY